jgi:hypothetical protein
MEWKVKSLTAYPHLDGKDNVVYLVHWKRGLTEDVVLGWVWARISKEDIEVRAAKAEEDAKHPPPKPVPVALPWVTE